MMTEQNTAHDIAADTAPQRDNAELFAKALELAPRFDTVSKSTEIYSET